MKSYLNNMIMCAAMASFLGCATNQTKSNRLENLVDNTISVYQSGNNQKALSDENTKKFYPLFDEIVGKLPECKGDYSKLSDQDLKGEYSKVSEAYNQMIKLSQGTDGRIQIGDILKYYDRKLKQEIDKRKNTNY